MCAMGANPWAPVFWTKRRLRRDFGELRVILRHNSEAGILSSLHSVVFCLTLRINCTELSVPSLEDPTQNSVTLLHIFEAGLPPKSGCGFAD